MKYPPLIRYDVQQIESYFHQHFRERGVPKGGMGELWYRVIYDFLATKGFDMIPGTVRNKEYRVMEQGKSAEYIAALLESVSPATQISEHDQVMLLLTASVEDRELALKKIFY